MMLPVILMDDDARLREVSKPVESATEVQQLAATMALVLHERGGRGLAAIQIGVPKRVLIVRHGPEFRGNCTYQVFINPEITRTLNRFTTEREGCLSIPPRKWGDVSRPAKCDATWTDLEGNVHSATLTGETARVFQHEFDHLNGVLMTDKLALAA